MTCYQHLTAGKHHIGKTFFHQVINTFQLFRIHSFLLRNPIFQTTQGSYLVAGIDLKLFTHRNRQFTFSLNCSKNKLCTQLLRNGAVLIRHHNTFEVGGLLQIKKRIWTHKNIQYCWFGCCYRFYNFNFTGGKLVGLPRVVIRPVKTNYHIIKRL